MGVGPCTNNRHCFGDHHVSVNGHFSWYVSSFKLHANAFVIITVHKCCLKIWLNPLFADCNIHVLVLNEIPLSESVRVKGTSRPFTGPSVCFYVIETTLNHWSTDWPDPSPLTRVGGISGHYNITQKESNWFVLVMAMNCSFKSLVPKTGPHYIKIIKCVLSFDLYASDLIIWVQSFKRTYNKFVRNLN